MWLTEEQAHQVSCPIFALAFYLTDKLEDDACQGSRCAWWRWAEGPHEPGNKKRGHCGFAGIPVGPPR